MVVTLRMMVKACWRDGNPDNMLRRLGGLGGIEMRNGREGNGMYVCMFVESVVGVFFITVMLLLHVTYTYRSHPIDFINSARSYHHKPREMVSP